MSTGRRLDPLAEKLVGRVAPQDDAAARSTPSEVRSMATKSPFNDLRKRFLNLLHERERSDDDANTEISRLSARAARVYGLYAAEGVPGFDMDLSRLKFENRMVSPYNERKWEVVWCTICWKVALNYPSLGFSLHTVGAYELGDGTARINRRRWRDRAGDYAEVCGVLASLTSGAKGDGSRSGLRKRSDRGKKKSRRGKGGRPKIDKATADARWEFKKEVETRKRDRGTTMKEVAADCGIEPKEGKAWLQWCRDQKSRQKISGK